MLARAIKGTPGKGPASLSLLPRHRHPLGRGGGEGQRRQEAPGHEDPRPVEEVNLLLSGRQPGSHEGAVDQDGGPPLAVDEEVPVAVLVDAETRCPSVNHSSNSP